MEQKLLDFCKKQARLLWGLALLAVSLLLIAWVTRDIAQTVDGRSEYRIVNDTYDRVLQPENPATGLCQSLTLTAGETLYGVRLDFATFARVPHGTFTAYLHRAGEDTPLASAALDMTTILDNTFMDVVFDAPYTPEADEAVLLTLAWAGDTAEDTLGLWAGEGDAAGMTPAAEAAAPGEAAGNSLGATLAIQYITDHITYGAALKAALLPAALLLLAVGVAWWCFVYKKIALQRAFCLVGALLGLAFALITPPLAAPDEYAHVAGCYALASKALQQPTFDADGKLYMRAGDALYMTDDSGDIGAFAYKKLADHITDAGLDSTCTTPVKVRATDTKVTILFLPQTLGILLARLLGLGFYPMVLLGRVCNLALYLALCSFAIRQIPRGKTLLTCVALLPMGLQLAGSFSADVLVLGAVYSFTALCLRGRAQKLTKPEWAALAVLAAVIGPAKAIYLPVVLLCWLLPAEQLGGRARQWPVRLGLLGLAALGWILANGNYLKFMLRDIDTVGAQKALLALAAVVAVGAGLYGFVLRGHKKRQLWFWRIVVLAVLAALPVAFYMLTHMWGGWTDQQMVEALQPNGDSAFTFGIGYIFRHFGATMKLLLNTVAEQSADWLAGLLGTALGEQIVYGLQTNALLLVGLVLVCLAAALRVDGQRPRLGGAARWTALALPALVIGLCLLAAITWTPINYTEIFGVQGRYFLPVLPLLLLFWGDNRLLTLKRDCSGEICLAGTLLCVLVLLQGWSLYAGWLPKTV